MFPRIPPLVILALTDPDPERKAQGRCPRSFCESSQSSCVLTAAIPSLPSFTSPPAFIAS